MSANPSTNNIDDKLSALRVRMAELAAQKEVQKCAEEEEWERVAKEAEEKAAAEVARKRKEKERAESIRQEQARGSKRRVLENDRGEEDAVCKRCEKRGEECVWREGGKGKSCDGWGVGRSAHAQKG